MMTRLCFVLAMIWVICGVVLHADEAPAPEARLLTVGDRLRYQVVEDGDNSVELAISNTGMVDIPYHGPMKAAGRPLPDLVASIKSALEAKFYVTATVRVEVLAFSQGAVNRGRVHLAGQVRRVGPIEIDLSEKTTLGQTILAAGGLADFADPRNVRIIRREGAETRTIRVDLREVLNRGRIDKDVELMDGDFIIVDERLVNW
jgi:polysaccharide export outer membrane protein